MENDAPLPAVDSAANPYAPSQIVANKKARGPRSFKWLRKYVIAAVPLFLSCCVAMGYFHMADRRRQGDLRPEPLDRPSVRNFKSLPADRIAEFGEIAIFWGGGVTAMLWVYCAFLDWRAADDRRRLDEALSQPRV
jgi:hypothetical protein